MDTYRELYLAFGWILFVCVAAEAATYLEGRTMADDSSIKIMILDRGHVRVARVSRHPDLGFHWLLSPGRTIRRWGTTNGLNELVNGPLEATILDALAVSAVPYRAVLEIIDVSEEAWSQYLTTNEPLSARPKATKASR